MGEAMKEWIQSQNRSEELCAGETSGTMRFVKVHRYGVRTNPTGSRTLALEAPGKPKLEIATPPDFEDGIDGVWGAGGASHRISGNFLRADSVGDCGTTRSSSPQHPDGRDRARSEQGRSPTRRPFRTRRHAGDRCGLRAAGRVGGTPREGQLRRCGSARRPGSLDRGCARGSRRPGTCLTILTAHRTPRLKRYLCAAE